jgi:hypothetical protein
MDRGDIAEGITLFRYSNTAMSNGRAQTVVQTLLDLYRRNEIGFHVLARASLRGTWQRGRAGHDLRINTTYFEGLPPAVQLGRLSLLLVHEATHATVNFTKLYDEMAARMLPILYYRELSGPGVFNEANDPPRPGQPSRIVRIAPGSLPEFEEQSEALRRDQLIDQILSIRSYTRPSYITPPWIVDNLTHWRGLRNRWPGTRGVYIRVLTESVDFYFTRHIVDVMESIESRADWDEMMDKAGSLRAIQIALDDVSARAEYGGRIVALERRWRVHLREQIPVPPQGRR